MPQFRAETAQASQVVTSGVVHLQFHPSTATPVLAAADKAGHVALWAVRCGLHVECIVP